MTAPTIKTLTAHSNYLSQNMYFMGNTWGTQLPEQELHEIICEVASTDAKTVCDLGSDFGITMSGFLEAGYKTYGIEINPTLFDLANQRLQKLFPCKKINIKHADYFSSNFERTIFSDQRKITDIDVYTIFAWNKRHSQEVIDGVLSKIMTPGSRAIVVHPVSELNYKHQGLLRVNDDKWYAHLEKQ